MGAIDFTGITRELELRADLGTATGGKGTLVELKAAGGDCRGRRRSSAAGNAKGDPPTRRAATRVEPYRTGTGAPKVAKLQGKRLPLRQSQAAWWRTGENGTSPHWERVGSIRQIIRCHTGKIRAATTTAKDNKRTAHGHQGDKQYDGLHNTSWTCHRFRSPSFAG